MTPRHRRVKRLTRLGLAVFISASALGLSPSLTPFQPARASIMVGLELPDLVRQSEHIAVVEVATVSAAWDERHERIYSTIELKVVETWKAGTPSAGAPAKHLTIVQPGGTVGDINMTVTGLSKFAPGERTLVFLRGPANRAQVVGMTQGKRAVRFEAVSKKWMVSPPDLRSATLVKPPPTGVVPAPAPVATSARPSTTTAPAPAPTAATPVAARELPLDELRSEVKRLIGTQGK